MDAGCVGHHALAAVFAVGEEQDGLVLLAEMRQGEIRQLRITFSSLGTLDYAESSSKIWTEDLPT
jgi:hypothetical protein